MVWRIEEGGGLSQDLAQIIPWLGASVSPLRNYAHASRVRKVLSIWKFPEQTGEATQSR